MKKVFFLFVIILFINCSQNNTEETVEEGICELTACENNGNLKDCACECPEGYTGLRCQGIDPNAVQKLLDDNVSPFLLINSGIQLNNIYGKNYKSGIIFHVNIVDKIIKITAPKETEKNLQWTNAFQYCEDLDFNGNTDWYLPNLDEVKEIREILYAEKKVGEFNDDYYWTSETVENNPNDAYGVFFLNGNVGPIEKDRMNDVSYNSVRAVRKIQL